MRVCLIPTPRLNKDSGSTVYARSQAETLASQGIEVHVIVSEPLELCNVVVHPCPIPIPHPVVEYESTQPEDYHSAINVIVEQLLKIHRKTSLDLVHGFYASFTGYAACIFQALTGVPAIISCFGRDINPGMSSPPIYARFAAGCLPQAKLILASNEATMANILTLTGTTPSRTKVMAMGVDESIFNPNLISQNSARRQLGWSEDNFIVISVLSAMLPEKRVELIVNEMLPLLKECPEALLVLVGSDYDGTIDGAEPRIRALVSPQELNKKIIFTGLQPHCLIPLYLASADVLVDARSVNNYSSALIEALAMNRPVVVSEMSEQQINKGSSSHYISFSSKHQNDLTRTLTYLLKNPVQREKLSEKAKVWWSANRSERSLDELTKSLIDNYKRVLGES